MKVRKLDAHDAAAYQRLRLRALEESPTAFSASYSDEVDRTAADLAPRLIAKSDGSLCVFGAFVGNELVGLVAFIRSSREKLRHCAELAGMYVAPEFRNRGIGTALMDAAIAHARALQGVRQLKLTVNASNLAARSLYQKMGFKCFGIEPEAMCVDGTYYDEESYILRLGAS